MVHEAAKTSKISIVIILGRVLLIANILHSSNDHPYLISFLWNKPAYSHIKNYFSFGKISFSHKTVGVLLLQYLHIFRDIGLSNIIYFLFIHWLILLYNITLFYKYKYSEFVLNILISNIIKAIYNLFINHFSKHFLVCDHQQNTEYLSH